MFSLLHYDSFFNVWYWVCSVGIWTTVCSRTLGVPHDLVLRGRRLPEAARRVDILAGISAARLAGLSNAMGVPIAAAAGFGLARLGGAGFAAGIEAAQAAFMLGLPLALVMAANVQLARAVERDGLRGEGLRRALSRRRAWNQTIAILALVAASFVALAHLPLAL